MAVSVVMLRTAIAGSPGAIPEASSYEYIETPRRSDHIWSVSDLSNAHEYYGWCKTRDLESIFEEILDSWRERLRRTVRAN